MSSQQQKQPCTLPPQQSCVSQTKEPCHPKVPVPCHPKVPEPCYPKVPEPCHPKVPQPCITIVNPPCQEKCPQVPKTKQKTMSSQQQKQPCTLPPQQPYVSQTKEPCHPKIPVPCHPKVPVPCHPKVPHPCITTVTPPAQQKCSQVPKTKQKFEVDGEYGEATEYLSCCRSFQVTVGLGWIKVQGIWSWQELLEQLVALWASPDICSSPATGEMKRPLVLEAQEVRSLTLSIATDVNSDPSKCTSLKLKFLL
ncbi:uncharacterized protein [Notamacropus eugenii]|uniref:uncharacterized protein n=1 Tax=Notamacropus eugenii TaxID=9315 RepID=UPI003B67A771